MKGIKGFAVFWVLMYILVGWVGVYAVDAAPPGHGKGHGRHGGAFQEALTRLNLSDAQKHDIANVLKQHREEMLGLRSQMFEAKKALFAAVTANEFDEDAVVAAAIQAGEAEKQLALMRAKLFDRIRDRLTPQQKSELEQLVADFASRMQKHMEHKTSMLDRWIDENSNL
jgi:Spy/CpxP family protein refolding chaperone